MEHEVSRQRRRRTQHAQSSSASMQDSTRSLSHEVISEILVRLPVKSLLRFRSVSTSWLDSISCPQFAKTHLNLSATNEENAHQRLMLSFNGDRNNLKVCSIWSLLYEDEPVDVPDFNYPKKCPFELVGSFNGLVCLMNGPINFLLWNPSCRKFREVTTFTDGPVCGGDNMYGFGYDELHDDYKVVHIFYANYMDWSCDIYSFKSDSCRGVDFPGVELDTDPGKLVNGKLHWIPAGPDFSCNDTDIVYIDLADEKWGKLEQPCYGKERFDLNLAVLGSDLSIFCSYKLENDFSMYCSYERTFADVWVMKEYGVKESWAKLYTITFPPAIRTHELSPLFYKSNKGEILLEFGSRFMIYNPRDDSIRYSKVAKLNSYFASVIYTESLVCPFPNESMMQE